MYAAIHLFTERLPPRLKPVTFCLLVTMEQPNHCDEAYSQKINWCITNFIMYMQQVFHKIRKIRVLLKQLICFIPRSLMMIDLRMDSAFSNQVLVSQHHGDLSDCEK